MELLYSLRTRGAKISWVRRTEEEVVFNRYLSPHSGQQLLHILAAVLGHSAASTSRNRAFETFRSPWYGNKAGRGSVRNQRLGLFQARNSDQLFLYEIIEQLPFLFQVLIEVLGEDRRILFPWVSCHILLSRICKMGAMAEDSSSVRSSAIRIANSRSTINP